MIRYCLVSMKTAKIRQPRSRSGKGQKTMQLPFRTDHSRPCRFSCSCRLHGYQTGLTAIRPVFSADYTKIECNIHLNFKIDMISETTEQLKAAPPFLNKGKLQIIPRFQRWEWMRKQWHPGSPTSCFPQSLPANQGRWWCKRWSTAEPEAAARSSG